MTESYLFKLAATSSEIKEYFNLRRSIFVEEQNFFKLHDVDDTDTIAYPIIAQETKSDRVVGVVRIYEPEAGLWYGGRLGTHPEYRRGWQIGKGLIYKAVTTANTWGCTRFLATVQSQNVRFFQRLHWASLEEITIGDRAHHLMEADLSFYPAGTAEIRPELVPFQREA